MADVLIDSSVWIEYFRRGKGAVFDLVDVLLDEDRVLVCGMVELELLHGARPDQKKALEDLLPALPFVETVRADFRAAGERLRELQRRGILIPASDCLIGVQCVRRGLSLLALDSHFDRLPDLKRLRA